MRHRGTRAVAVAAGMLLLSGPAGSAAVPAAESGGGSGPAGDPVTPADVRVHELHETYANIAVEGSVVAGRFLFFQDQLERALGSLLDADAVELRPGDEADFLVLRYLRDHLSIEADGVPLEPSLLGSGQERLAHHMGWWVTVRFQAPSAVAGIRVRNTLLFELHDDQRNIMKVAWFPGGAPATYTATAAAAEVVVHREAGPTG